MPRDQRQSDVADRVRFQHMLDAAVQIEAFSADRTRADLDSDAMFLRAVVHAIQEIGEAASRVTPEGRVRVSGLPWNQVVGMRHRLVHVYWDINRDLVWEVVVRDVPMLRRTLESALAGWPLSS